MQQFRAGVDAVVVVEAPWITGHNDGANIGEASALSNTLSDAGDGAAVTVYVRSPSGAETSVAADGHGGAWWTATIPNAAYESGIWQFIARNLAGAWSSTHGLFEWGGNYETICAAADASLANLDAIFAAAADAETDAATAAVQSTAGAADAATAATQATIAATQSTIAASQSTAGAASASTAATQSTNAAIDAAKAALNLSAGRFFQYTAGAVSPAPKSKLWLRNAADSGWAGYYPCYANLSTGGAWPLAWADVQWPTLYAGITSLGAFVADTAGPT